MVEKILSDANALLKGHFMLTSGLHSEYYVEKIKMINNPKYVQALCALAAEKLQHYDFDVVIGPAYGGIVLAYELARILNKKFIFTQRKDEKMTIRSGFDLVAGDKAVVFEDIVTTGGSVKEVIEVLEDRQIQIQAICCIVDRSNGVASFGYDFLPLHTMNIQAFEPENCPLCKASVPMVKPGASDKGKK